MEKTRKNNDENDERTTRIENDENEKHKCKWAKWENSVCFFHIYYFRKISYHFLFWDNGYFMSRCCWNRQREKGCLSFLYKEIYIDHMCVDVIWKKKYFLMFFQRKNKYKSLHFTMCFLFVVCYNYGH